MKKKTKKIVGELVFGVHPLLELLKAKRRRVITIYMTKVPPKSWRQIEPLVHPRVNIQYVQREKLHELAGTTDHQGIVALATPFVIRKKFFDPNRQSFLLMLDGIQDPRNLGAILRSAYCTGVDGVIITQKKSAPLNATAIKSSAGLAEHLEIYYAPSATDAAKELKQAGYNIYLATISGENALDIAYTRPLCIVIGNEAVGISKNILKSGVQVALPQKTANISYNASVAAGILLFLVGAVQTK